MRELFKRLYELQERYGIDMHEDVCIRVSLIEQYLTGFRNLLPESPSITSHGSKVNLLEDDVKALTSSHRPLLMKLFTLFRIMSPSTAQQIR